MLFIEGTDIHWGDPVNTSSKLGQDIAKDGQVIIMPVIKEACENSVRFPDFQNKVTFEESSFVKSKVTFQCWIVHDNKYSSF